MNQRPGKVVSVLALLSAFVALAARAEPPHPLLVVEVSEQDHAAAQRLLALTEQPTQLVRMPEARDPALALPLARAALADRVVIFDQGAQRVVVLSTRDASVLTRATDASEGAPFVAAFVAVELLALPSPAPPPVLSPPPPPRPATSFVLGLRGGLEVLPLTPYRGALRPALGVFLGVRPPAAALGWRVELWASPHATHTEASATGRLSLTRDDFAARAGALWSRDRLALSGFGQLGLARIVAAWEAPQREQSRRAVVALGLGLEPSVLLWNGLALYAASSLIAHAPPADYRFGGESLREPRLTWTLAAGVYVTLPI